MKKMVYIILFSFVFLVSCSNITTNNNLTIYDGDYLTYTSIIENKDEVAFTIKNGAVKGKILNGTIDEKRKLFTNQDKEKYKFIYNNGELIIKENDVVKAYKRGSSAFKYVNQVLGKYEHDLKPKLTKILSNNYKEFLKGSYSNENYESNIDKIIITNTNFTLYYKDNTPSKTLEFNLKDITFDEPKWSEKNSEDDNRILETYESCSSVEDIMNLTNFDIKLVGQDQNGEKYDIYISYIVDNETRKISIRKENDSKNNYVDDNFQYSK